LRLTAFPLLLLALLIGLSCTPQKKSTLVPAAPSKKKSLAFKLKKNTFSFESEPNGIANLKLKFFDDKSFQLFMIIYADTNVKKNNKPYRFEGRWSEEEDKIKLVFRKPVPQVKSIFDNHFGETPVFEIVNENTVRFANTMEQLTLWGVLCSKKTSE